MKPNLFDKILPFFDFSFWGLFQTFSQDEETFFKGVGESDIKLLPMLTSVKETADGYCVQSKIDPFECRIKDRRYWIGTYPYGFLNPVNESLVTSYYEDLRPSKAMVYLMNRVIKKTSSKLREKLSSDQEFAKKFVFENLGYTVTKVEVK